MSWLLAGYCGLALINISGALQISQWPWYIDVKSNSSVFMVCESSGKSENNHTQWYKAINLVQRSGEVEIEAGGRIEMKNWTLSSRLHIKDVHIEDRGWYFCKFGKIWGTGTELRVTKPITQDKTEMKDGLIIFQGMLLAVCVGAALLRKEKLREKMDSIYEEPETDHIYEGLTIDSFGGGLYEELTAYSQPEGVEAPWE